MSSTLGAICWCIYQPSREWGGVRTLLPVLMAIIESGALYTAGVLTTLILFLIESNAQFSALDLLMPLVVSDFRLPLDDHFDDAARRDGRAWYTA